MIDEGFLRLKISLIYANARIDALQEVLSTLAPEFDGQSLDSWVDRRVGELSYESLGRIEDADPAHAAIIQVAIDQAKAILQQKPPNETKNGD